MRLSLIAESKNASGKTEAFFDRLCMTVFLFFLSTPGATATRNA
jgi:hypothetical protein